MAIMGEAEFDVVSQVRDLAARRDITDAVHRYMRGLDRLDADLVRSAFHSKASIDCGLMSGTPDEFVPFAMDLLGSMDASHHMLGQVRIVLSGGSGMGECYFQAWHRRKDADGAVGDLFIAGRYLDEYAFREGRWGIAARMLVTDWVTDDPGTLDFFNANPSAPRGARRGLDPSESRQPAFSI